MALKDLRSCKCLYLAEIGEPAINQLQLVLEEAVTGSVGEGLAQMQPEMRELLKDSRPIAHVVGCRVFELHWSSYVAYAVTNESFTIAEPETSVGTGESPVIEYSKSAFLDYTAQATFATKEFPGPLRHWCVHTLDHIIDVISTVEAVVTVRTAK